MENGFRRNPLACGLLGIVIGMCAVICMLAFPLCCTRNTNARDSVLLRDTLFDTLYVKQLPEGGFTYNLPCRVVCLNQEKEGKSLLFIWLHGGVYVPNLHNLRDWNHLNCCEADDKIIEYLTTHGIKSIALFPICHRAGVTHCVSWIECYDDVKAIIDDYVGKGLVDENRIYLAGSSDGGTGAWDYAEHHGDVFAAIIPMSCGNPRMSSTPVYFFNTGSEGDYSSQVNALNERGAKIRYKRCPEVGHGEDARECTEELLDTFFSHVR